MSQFPRWIAITVFDIISEILLFLYAGLAIHKIQISLHKKLMVGVTLESRVLWVLYTWYSRQESPWTNRVPLHLPDSFPSPPFDYTTWTNKSSPTTQFSSAHTPPSQRRYTSPSVSSASYPHSSNPSSPYSRTRMASPIQTGHPGLGQSRNNLPRGTRHLRRIRWDRIARRVQIG